MSNVVKKGKTYICKNAAPGWEKVVVVDFDSEFVVVRLLEKQNFWSYDKVVAMKRELFEEKYEGYVE